MVLEKVMVVEELVELEGDVVVEVLVELEKDLWIESDQRLMSNHVTIDGTTVDH